MATLREKIKRLLDNLSLELQRGVRCLQVVQTIRQARSEGYVEEDKFFNIVLDTCMRESLLSLAKLAISEKESITIDYLLNCALEVPSKGFRNATRAEVESSVLEHRNQLEALAPLIDDLKMQRDRVLAHLDRKHVNEPEVMSTIQINLAEIERAFEIFGGIINTYRRYFGITQLSIEDMRRDLREEMAVLVHQMTQVD